jgi:hypothetical protein
MSGIEGWVEVPHALVRQVTVRVASTGSSSRSGREPPAREEHEGVG